MSGLVRFVTERTPKGWTTKPLWALFRREKLTGFPNEELLSVYRDYGVIPKSSRDDNHNKESEDLGGYQLVSEGSLVTNKMKAWQGSIAISRHRGIVSPAYYVYRPLSNEHDQFLHYLLRSDPYIALYRRISKGVRVNQWDLEHEALRTIPVMLPDRDTQRAIAEFLDCETARIDELIDRKQNMARCLSERFDNLVRKGVTSGVSRHNTKYSDSGIDYIGHTPTHWSVEKTGWRYEIQLGKMLDSSKQTGQFSKPYLRVADVQWDEILTADLPSMDFGIADRQRYRLRLGDLIVNEGGSYVGRSAIWQDQIEECYYQKALHRLRPRNPHRDTSEYFLWVMWFATKHGIFVANGNQTTIDHLTAEALYRFRFVFPPINEQFEISSFLAEERNKTRSTTQKINASVQRLGEYRAALITAAVTGQIDTTEYARKGDTDRRLDAIEAEMRA
ncbi:restriction endonuclease subunit S [uncultured Hyphomonas sp.]|uniref:restriction endonuclease subunit S n=1 Tax=uncultured Hyphomonas sp. TaxID=225298 RepID=UPI0030D9E0A6